MKIKSKTNSYSLTPATYMQAIEHLSEAIDHSDYFSGAVEFCAETVQCRLVATVIVYRTTTTAPDGVWHPITQLVPVWWEFHTSHDDDSMLNDFSFEEMVTYLR